MQTVTAELSKKTRLGDICAYSVGEGANSLIMNGIAGFAMLYYTEALGLDYKLAGIALAISVFWDAITDPVMGHISDNTRSKYGRRHPYLLFGGIVMAICFYFLWAVPEVFTSAHLLFWYLVTVNILLRTAITVFFVPYTALGFEVCTDYDDRSKLQSVRTIAAMAANLAGPAMAWAIFFRKGGDEGSVKIASNYANMGTAFSIATALFVLCVVFFTRKYIIDTRKSKEIVGNDIRHLCKDIKDVVMDRNPRTIFIFTGIVILGVVLVSSLQMYVYVYFMKFSAVQKSIAHGSTMVGMALGAWFSVILTKKIDKKPAVCTGVMVSVICNVILAALFLTGLVPRSFVYIIPSDTLLIGGVSIPVSMLLFVLFNALYWLGNGILMPLCYSMMADSSEVNKYNTGVLKDGSYSAMLSFVFKTSISLGMLLSGYCLSWIGFVADGETHSPESINRLAMVFFLGGSAISFTAMLSLTKYPITRNYMNKVKAALAERQENSI